MTDQPPPIPRRPLSYRKNPGCIDTLSGQAHTHHMTATAAPTATATAYRDQAFLTSSDTYAAVIVHGTRPIGRATGDERWATVTEDDTDVVITAYLGWGITDVVRLSGPAARTLAGGVLRGLDVRP